MNCYYVWNNCKLPSVSRDLRPAHTEVRTRRIVARPQGPELVPSKNFTVSFFRLVTPERRREHALLCFPLRSTAKTAEGMRDSSGSGREETGFVVVGSLEAATEKGLWDFSRRPACTGTIPHSMAPVFRETTDSRATPFRWKTPFQIWRHLQNRWLSGHRKEWNQVMSKLIFLERKERKKRNENHTQKRCVFLTGPALHCYQAAPRPVKHMHLICAIGKRPSVIKR